MGNNKFCQAAFVICVSFVLLSDAAVDFVIVGGGTSFVEKSELTLKCTVPSFSLGSTPLNWEVDSVSYADCVFTCNSYPPFPGNYTFTFDTVNGEFFLKINSLQLSDSGRIFKCESGTSDPTLSFTVTLAPGLSTPDEKTTISDYVTTPNTIECQKANCLNVTTVTDKTKAKKVSYIYIIAVTSVGICALALIVAIICIVRRRSQQQSKKYSCK